MLKSYPSGNVAVICVKCKAGNQSFYTIAYSDEPNARTLACFTPQGRGFCNYSEKVIRYGPPAFFIRFFNKKPTSRPSTKSFLIFGQNLILKVS